MRILVATSETNGSAAGDYTFCVEGELVYMQEPCAADLRNPDGPCGCGRGFAGTNSHRATSTAKVVDSSLTEAEVLEAVRSSLIAGGWLDPARASEGEADGLVRELVRNMAMVAAHFSPGSVVRRRLSQYFVGLSLPS